jgi:hypothetical protein
MLLPLTIEAVSNRPALAGYRPQRQSGLDRITNTL